MGCSKSSTRREVYHDRCLPHETRRNLKQLHIPPKRTGEERTKPRASRKREITKIRVEINEIETKNTVEEINKSTGSFKR